MSFKEKLQARIQKNAVKSELSWTDKDGNFHTDTVLLKRSKLPIIGDWARIYPPIDEYGKIKWINLIFGGHRNLIKLIIVLVIIAMVLSQFNDLFIYIDTIKESVCYQSCLETMKQTTTPSLNSFN